MASRPRSLSMGDLIRSPNRYMPEPVQMMYGRRLGAIVARAAESGKAAIDSYLASLPKLQEDDLAALGHIESTCPICLNPLLAILAEEETAVALDTPAHPTEELGVTKLAGCSHIFCVKDIRHWVLQGHNTCPFCRSALMNLPDRVDENLMDEVSALGRQIEETISTYTGRTGILPLTPDQLTSLSSAITLLQQGDGPDLEALGLHPTDNSPLEDDEAVSSNDRDDEHDRDRDSFGGMYS